ncbi:MAG: YceD family protein [Prochloraceae cyanobacterium]|nr:YceD family protein [Prochloraceae cyanobacterium]
MEVIYIPQLLKAPDRTEEITLDEPIAGLNTLTPVKGAIVITHGGTYLEVSAKAETIITVVCDRCLANYNHRLSVDTSEIIWLEDNADETAKFVEREIPLEDLSEKLSPWGYFEPESWLYEQLSLAMPMRQLCGEECPGAADLRTENTDPLVDSRWASLAALKEKFSG